ncbi:MAG: division/cell wall cluster transcriptional repressor MraZ [Anaerolineales bacterium]|nr:division/cell wall cluster transcriptional repressor MraZ [Anaerolineales bacterium]
MFLGQYHHTLDGKYRLIIPARFRELLTDGAYIIHGLDKNLMVMTKEKYESINKCIDEQSFTNPKIRDLRRRLFAGGDIQKVDSAGRILLPQFLREEAGIVSDVMLVGAGNYFEIWAPEKWRLKMEKIQDTEANEQMFAEFNIPIG